MSITEQTLRIGDKVVYPNHGVGVIEQISSRTIGATVEKFFTLKINSSSLRVSIPLGNLHNVGLRRVIKNGEGQKIVISSPLASARTTAIGSSASRKTPRRCGPV